MGSHVMFAFMSQMPAWLIVAGPRRVADDGPHPKNLTISSPVVVRIHHGRQQIMKGFCSRRASSKQLLSSLVLVVLPALSRAFVATNGNRRPRFFGQITTRRLAQSTIPASPSPTTGRTSRDIRKMLQASELKRKLYELAERTDRGFSATAHQQRQVRQVVEQLRRYNPTAEPASSYYSSYRPDAVPRTPQLMGKWTLVYTDAPDIVSLDQNKLLATLGRVGQECVPPYINNVIEWRAPGWSHNLPLTGRRRRRGRHHEDAAPTTRRVIQKVVTQGIADPTQPTRVQLELAGLQVEAVDGHDNGAARNLTDAIREHGLVAGLLCMNPIDCHGPVHAPFGQFDVLYLDDELRVIRTNQGDLAVNVRIVRPEDEWF